MGIFMGPAEPLARSLIEKAARDGKVTEASLVELAEKLFTEADKDKSGKLDEQELAEAINALFPSPQFGRPPGGERPPGRPEREQRKEERR